MVAVAGWTMIIRAMAARLELHYREADLIYTRGD
jgi:hypothetical protein